MIIESSEADTGRGSRPAHGEGTVVTRGLKWSLIDLLGRQVLSMLVFALLARLLSPSSFGLIGLVTAYLGFVGIVSEQGFATALVQRKELHAGHLHAAFWVNLAWAGLLVVATLVLAPAVAALLGDPQLVPFLRWSSLSLIVNALSVVPAALFVRQLDFRSTALRTMVGTVCGGVVGISMALTGFGVWSLVGQQLAGACTGTACLWLSSRYRPRCSFRFADLRDLLEVASSIFATSLLWYFTCRFDLLVIGRVIGVQAAGLYVIAGRLTDIARLVTHQPVAAVSLPALARLQGDHRALRDAIRQGMRFNAAVTFAVFPGLALVVGELLPLAFGSQWTEASPICSLLCLNSMFIALQVFVHPALLASGGVGKFVIFSVISTAGVAIACVVGAQFGVIELVVALIINNVIMAVPPFLFLRARIGLTASDYCRPCAAPALSSLLMVAAVMTVDHFGHLTLPILPLLLLKVISGALTYLLALRAQDRLLLDEVLHFVLKRPLPAPSEQ